MDNDVSLAPSNDGHSLLPPSGRSRSPKKKTKKANTVPLAEKCYLISVIYNAQVICSASETASGKGIISFASTQLLGCGSLNPPSLQRALAPAKSAALVASGSLKCSVCDRPAENVCSSLVINQRSNGDELERFAVLDVSEQMICSCGDSKCMSSARKRRNDCAGQRGGGLLGYRIALRCALEPISKLISTVTKKHPPTANACVGQKENASGNISNDEKKMSAKKMRVE